MVPIINLDHIPNTEPVSPKKSWLFLGRQTGGKTAVSNLLPAQNNQGHTT